MQGVGGIGGLLAVQVGDAWYFPSYDNNGNVLAYVNEQGAIVAEYIYDAFGRTIEATGLLADTFRHRFSTKYYDTETGFYYYGYRFYAPELMRWINRDPMEESGGLNVNCALHNNPIANIDILGQSIVAGNFYVIHIDDNPLAQAPLPRLAQQPAPSSATPPARNSCLPAFLIHKPVAACASRANRREAPPNHKSKITNLAYNLDILSQLLHGFLAAQPRGSLKSIPMPP